MTDEPRGVRSESMTGSPLSIDYATPNMKEVAGNEVDKLFHIGRRVIFAVGIGLLLYGIGEGCTVRRGSAPECMGWGAGIAALVMPWEWRRLRTGK